MGHLLVWLALVGAAHAQEARDEAEDDEAYVVEVEAEAAPQAATTRTLDADDLRTYPARDAADLLTALPGLHLSSHGGRGKAPQILVRGFDADHGADLAVDVEGIPLNERSNVHAHGYLDLNIIPSFLVREITLSAGPGDAPHGSFGIAGRANYRLGVDHEGWTVRLGGGTDRGGLVQLAWRPDGAEPGTFLAAGADLGLGVTDGRGWRHVVAGGGWQGHAGPLDLRTFVLVHDGTFASPGAVPIEELPDNFYGSDDAADTGATRRLLASLQLGRTIDRRAWSVVTYASLRQLELSADHTGFVNDPVDGDRTLQAHDAVLTGVRWSRAQGFDVAKTPWTWRTGTDLQLDLVHLTDTNAAAVATRDTTAQSTAVAAWTDLTARPHATVELTAGLRAGITHQHATFRAESSPRDDGTGWTPTILPRARLLWRPIAELDVVAAYGRADRPPELDGLTAGIAPATLADSAEIGLRTRPTHWLDLDAAGFATFLDGEVLIDHLANRYVQAGPSRRLGATAHLGLQAARWLRVEFDATAVDARLTDTGERVPYVPPLVGSGAATVTAARISPKTTLDLGVRAWVLGPRPLTDGFVAGTSGAGRLVAGVASGPLRVDLAVDNLFGNRWRDGEFVFLSTDSPDDRSQLPTRHATAGEPTAARLTLTWRPSSRPTPEDATYPRLASASQ